jgi:hypothetical protein
MNLYALDCYTELVETLKKARVGSYHDAYLILRSKYSAAMTEKEMHKSLRGIQMNESKLFDFLQALYQAAASWVGKARDYFLGHLPTDLVRKVEKDMDKLREKAREVELTMEAPQMTPEDIQELERRIKEQIPPPTEEELAQVQKALKEGHRADDESMSWTEWRHKWFTLFLAYTIAMSLAGFSVFGLTIGKFSLIYLPALVLMLDDLLYQLGHHKYVAP